MTLIYGQAKVLTYNLTAANRVKIQMIHQTPKKYNSFTFKNSHDKILRVRAVTKDYQFHVLISEKLLLMTRMPTLNLQVVQFAR